MDCKLQELPTPLCAMILLAFFDPFTFRFRIPYFMLLLRWVGKGWMIIALRTTALGCIIGLLQPESVLKCRGNFHL